MSEARSALQGATAQGHVALHEMGLQGMVSLRVDLASPGLEAALKKITGHGLPKQREILGGLGRGVAWMSPDELLILCDHSAAEQIAQDLSAALGNTHHLALNVSDARAVFSMEGAGVRAVMAKLSPVDWHKDGFRPGEIRRSRLAQIPAAFWMPDNARVDIVCFRSVARYAFDLLSNAADSDTPLPAI